MAWRALEAVLLAAAVPRAAGTSSSSCTSVAVSGVGSLLSGVYRQEYLSSIYDASFYMAGGLDYYWMFLYNGAWTIEPGEADYPQYETQDAALHPTEISLDWTVCNGAGCTPTVATTAVVITCAGATSSSDATPSTCTDVVLSGAGSSSGTYRKAPLSSAYDEGYYMAGGVDYYYLYKYRGAWYIKPQIADYPEYRSYDDADHPVDISLEWGVCSMTGCDFTAAKTQPAFVCADSSTSEKAASACTSVTVAGLGDLDGTYDQTYFSSMYDAYFAMPAGSDTNIMYKYNDAWFIEPRDAGYPQYRSYDDAVHPADISLEWTECDIKYCDHTPAPAPPTIACEAGSPLSTPAPNSMTSTTDVSGVPSTTTTSSSGDIISPPPGTVGGTGPDGATPVPSTAPREVVDGETVQPNTGAGEVGGVDPESVAIADDDAAGGGDSGGLSVGGIVGIVAAALVAIGGGSFAFAFKHNNIHCCQRHSTVNHAPAHHA